MKFSFAIVIFAAAMATAVPHTFERRRFGQEGAIQPILSKAAALFDNGTDAGQIATFAGGAISKILAAADPCSLLDLGDEMITFGKGKLTGDKLKQFIDIVREGMAVEKNFNPFSADKRASICLDAAKPASNELRGILPLVDPSLQGAADANTKTQQLLQDIIAGTVDGVAQAQGKSVGQQMIDVLGFSDFQKSETLGAAGAAAAGGAAAGNAAAGGAAAAAATEVPPAAGGAEDSATIIARIEKGLADLKAACGNDGGAAAASAAAPAAAAAAPPAAAAAAATQAPPAAAATGNLQKSTSALGGIPPPSVINDGSDRPFKVENNDSFLNLGAALTRSCDIQANQCQNKFNSADRGDLKQGDCDKQRTTCNAANAA